MLHILLQGCRLLCEDYYAIFLENLNLKLNSFIEISVLKGNIKVK